jgi:hypothetical protein
MTIPDDRTSCPPRATRAFDLRVFTVHRVERRFGAPASQRSRLSFRPLRLAALGTSPSRGRKTAGVPNPYAIALRLREWRLRAWFGCRVPAKGGVRDMACAFSFSADSRRFSPGTRTGGQQKLRLFQCVTIIVLRGGRRFSHSHDHSALRCPHLSATHTTRTRTQPADAPMASRLQRMSRLT